MKSRFLLIFLITIVAACSPSKHTMYIEVRQPSKAGVDLAGKVVSVVYLESDDSIDSAFTNGMAEGFARTLENDYGTGEGSVGVYRMRKVSEENYSSRDSMLDLLVDTGSDLVFLMDEVKLGTYEANSSKVIVPFSMKMYCFDGMDKSETVMNFSGSSSASPDGVDAGISLAESFKSQWKTESYSLAYFDNEKWYKALDLAEVYDWKGAIDIWLGLLETNDPMKRSCAEYNIALACYMLGDYALASKWLDRSDEDNRLPDMSDTLWKRINARK